MGAVCYHSITSPLLTDTGFQQGSIFLAHSDHPFFSRRLRQREIEMVMKMEIETETQTLTDIDTDTVFSCHFLKFEM